MVRVTTWQRCLFAAGIATVTGTALLTPHLTATASAADACPDVEVVFARGTFEPAGVGATGQAFIEALQTRLAGRTVQGYAVNYPASLDFPRAADGIIDASNKVATLAASCPDTRIVLGGYSQGAAVAAYTTADTVPPGFTLPVGITGPMSASIADHVAGVALFGKPSTGFLHMLNPGAPPITVGHLYTAKTFDMCIPEDPVCSPDGNDQAAHGAYTSNGMVDQAADAVARAVTRHT